MKNCILVIILLAIVQISYSQNDIRLYTNEADIITDIQLSDSNDYMAIIEIRNTNTYNVDSSVVLKIGKNGIVMNTLNVSSHIANARVVIEGKFLKLMNGEYIALCNMFNDQEQKYKTGLLYFNDDLEITSVKMMGDTTLSQYSGAMMINSRNNLIVGGLCYNDTSTYSHDSIFIREYTLQGEKIKEGYFVDINASYSINKIIELPYYGVYVLDHYSNMVHEYIDVNLTSIRTVFNGCSGCMATHLAYQISDRKFIKGVDIARCNPNTGASYPNDVGFVVKDTTPSIMYSYDSITVVHKFGEITNYDYLCGLDFVAPDTVFLLYKFIDTTISMKDVYTLQKLTTTGTIIWSKNYTCDVNRWLQVKATDSGILLYGRFWNGDNHFNDIYSLNPMIILLDKEGVIQSTTEINFKQAEILVYPNPSNGNFSITVDNDYEMSVYDITGRIIESKSVLEGNSSIDLSNQNGGVYFIRLKNDNQTKVIRIVKR